MEDQRRRRGPDPGRPDGQPGPAAQGLPGRRLHGDRPRRRRRRGAARPRPRRRPARRRGRLRGQGPVPPRRRDLRPARLDPDGQPAGVAQRRRRRQRHALCSRPSPRLIPRPPRPGAPGCSPAPASCTGSPFLAVWFVVSSAVAVALFLNSSRTIVLASHDALVRPTLNETSRSTPAPVLPDFRMDSGRGPDRLVLAGGLARRRVVGPAVARRPPADPGVDARARSAGPASARTRAARRDDGGGRRRAGDRRLLVHEDERRAHLRGGTPPPCAPRGIRATRRSSSSCGHPPAPGELQCDARGSIDRIGATWLRGDGAIAELQAGRGARRMGAHLRAHPCAGARADRRDGDRRDGRRSSAPGRRSSAAHRSPSGWRVTADTRGVTPGEHVLQLAVRVAAQKRHPHRPRTAGDGGSAAEPGRAGRARGAAAAGRPERRGLLAHRRSRAARGTKLRRRS